MTPGSVELWCMNFIPDERILAAFDDLKAYSSKSLKSKVAKCRQGVSHDEPAEPLLLV